LVGVDSAGIISICLLCGGFSYVCEIAEADSGTLGLFAARKWDGGEKPMNQDPKDSHFYDGIEENNNPLPRWWLVTFYLTVLFGIAYYGYYQLGSGPTLKQEFQAEVAKFETDHPASSAPDSPPEEKMESLIKDPQSLAKGKEVFMMRCLPCHGAAGQGGIGPNLTDDFWIHGDGKSASIYKVVTDGVLDKGMPPWGAILSVEERMQVTAFARSLRGTTPPSPKAAQGIEVAR
jgi:cytochrome c oxidase cbb3-type subunit 3